MAGFEPTAGLTDFDEVQGLREAWSRNISDLFDTMIYGPVSGGASALQELQKWRLSDSDIRFYNPNAMPIPSGSSGDNVTWRALPTSFDEMFPSSDQLRSFLDEQHVQRIRTEQGVRTVRTRVQDEYCEWKVFKDGDKIQKVVFTSEPAAYYQFLANDPYDIGKQRTHGLLLELYRNISGDRSIQLDAVLAPDGSLDSYNRWNSEHCIHMQQTNNTLGAEVNIAARSSLVRKDTRTGNIKTDAADLIECGRYGEAARQSDPSIGAAVNEAARENRFITLENPVGLYMTGLDTSGFTAPDGADCQTFWTVTRGKADADPARAMIVRAEFAVPPGRGYSVSDIRIGGAAIRFGAQIAEFVGMRLGVVVSRPSQLPAPRAIGCWTETPAALVAAAGLAGVTRA